MKKQLYMEGRGIEKEAIAQKLGVEAAVSRRWGEEIPADPLRSPESCLSRTVPLSSELASDGSGRLGSTVDYKWKDLNSFPNSALAGCITLASEPLLLSKQEGLLWASSKIRRRLNTNMS